MSISPSNNTSPHQDKFLKMCEWGHLHDAQRLFKTYPNDIDINYKKDQAFRLACSNGHLEVAEWLLSINASIDVQACDHWAAKMAKWNGHMPVLRMLKKHYNL